MRRIVFSVLTCLLSLTFAAQAQDSIKLANNPSLNPDGTLLAFDWNGDIWTVPTAGGAARALTAHPGKDRQPKFSPDGKEIAFISDREGTPQVFVMPVEGGTPTKLTRHTGGYTLEGWTPDGSKLLVSATRDYYWNPRQAMRFFLIPRDGKSGEELLFDDYGKAGHFSADGRRILFTREGPEWTRKGYHGSQAAQVWMYDLDSKKFKQVAAPDRGATNGLWKPDGGGCYLVSAKDGMFNLYEHHFATGEDKPLTKFADDSVVQPTTSADGRTIVFRHLFDFYRYQPASGNPPTKIAIRPTGDRDGDHTERRVLTTANGVSFAKDGLEVAFTAGGDLWVMDTELKEPKQITASVEEEREPEMSPDGNFVYFISDMHGECNVWRAERADKAKYWWQNAEFKLQRLTQDSRAKNNLSVSPDGSKIAYCVDRGDLWVADADGSNPKKLLDLFSTPEYQWSPDGKWLVYSAEDPDFNRDIWVMPVDGSKPAYNLSRNPFNDHNPTWSPDGKVIAFTGRRGPEEVDIHYVYLRADDDQVTSREKSVEKAIDKMNRSRKPREESRPPASGGKSGIKIDFDRLHERVHVISIPESTETGLFWSPDGKKLAFRATVDGRTGTYTVEIPDDTRPKQLSSATGSQARWLKNNTVVWLVNGVPASFSAGAPGATSATGGGGRPTAFPPGRRSLPTAPSSPGDASADAGTQYRFQALQVYDRHQRNAAIFDLAWRTMRDNFYDDRLGNRDWDAVRMKYLGMATQAVDAATLSTVVNMMLGELNGSHLGFYSTEDMPERFRSPASSGTPSATRWTEVTGYLGLRFDPAYAGPGLKVRDVMPHGPADHIHSRILAGETVVSIEGEKVDRTTDLARLLDGPPNRDATLIVAGKDGKERTVVIRTIPYPQPAAMRLTLYKKWVDDNRAAVDKLSGGKLGYLHIDAMGMPSFHRFQMELFDVASGKDGLIIDVRENGGGSTADHLLTCLAQPVHALTVPRGGSKPGYPQDRKIYATWNKPIVVMCNQNSFSNAEIFSHAIKTIKRGRLVGVPTAGGVISTGATQIMDAGMLRLPFRGWFLANDGQDMELNGAVPDVVIWNQPGEMPAGKDVQLEKAVETLAADVKAWLARPNPKLQKASERDAKPNQTGRPVVKDKSGE